MRLIVVLAIFLGVSGCSSLDPAPEEIISKAKIACESYGFKPETDAFSQCVMKLDQDYYKSQQAMAQQAIQSMTSRTTCTTSANVFGGGSWASGSSTTTCN